MKYQKSSAESLCLVSACCKQASSSCNLTQSYLDETKYSLPTEVKHNISKMHSYFPLFRKKSWSQPLSNFSGVIHFSDSNLSDFTNSWLAF